MNYRKKAEHWDLDNASQIFVNILSKGETTFSLIGFQLNDYIDRERMQNAINKVLTKRLPYYQVYLKKSLFCYVLEKTEDLPQIEEYPSYSCRYKELHNNNFLFQFFVSDKRIALEMSHIMTDGYGLLIFLLTVLAEYYRMAGVYIDEHPFIFDINGKIDPREWECAYKKFFDGKGPPQKIDRPAFIPYGDSTSFDKYYTTSLGINLDLIKQKAQEMSVNLVSFASGMYLWALQELYLEDLNMNRTQWGVPLRMQIPANLRNFYNSPCMKNFCYVYSPCYTIRNSSEIRSCEEIIQFTANRIRFERENNIIEKQINRNIRVSSALWFRYMPRALKELVLSLSYQIYARGVFSGVLTNLGNISLPLPLQERIDSIEVVPCNSPAPGRNSAMFSYMGNLEICIASTIKDLRLENKIMEKLDDMDIPFSMKSNRKST